jgi:hypothetical protein
VTSFLVETYTSASAIADNRIRACLAGSAPAPASTPVRYLRSIFVPSDEMCLHLFEAGSAEAVREAIERVGLAADRIVEARLLWEAEDGAVNQEIR